MAKQSSWREHWVVWVIVALMLLGYCKKSHGRNILTGPTAAPDATYTHITLTRPDEPWNDAPLQVITDGNHRFTNVIAMEFWLPDEAATFRLIDYGVSVPLTVHDMLQFTPLPDVLSIALGPLREPTPGNWEQRFNYAGGPPVWLTAMRVPEPDAFGGVVAAAGVLWAIWGQRRARVPLLALLAALACHGARAEGGFGTMQPYRKPPHAGLLGDIECHVPNPAIYQHYLANGWLAYAHESLHGANSALMTDQDHQGFYLMNDACWRCTAPRIRLSSVAAAVPVALRGHLYQPYLIQVGQGQDWYGLYMLDEITAFIAECYVGVELGLQKETVQAFEDTLQVWRYVQATREVCRRADYAEQAQLDEFCALLYGRIKQLWNILEDNGWRHTGRHL